MANNARVGTGTTIAFATSTFTADVVSIGLDTSVPAVDATHLASTGGREYNPGDLTDSTVTITINVKVGENPPVGADPEQITITDPDGDTEVFQGFIQSMSKTYLIDENLAADLNVVISGGIAYTAGT